MASLRPDRFAPDPRPPSMSLAGLFVRTFWMVLGTGLLALLAVRIVQRAPWSVSWIDAAYWATVVLVLAARGADVRWLGGRTAEGEPVTPADWRRYWVTLVGVSTAAWITAQAFQAG